MEGGGRGAYSASQTTMLHMKRLNQTESPIFVILCVLCFQRQYFFTFISYMASDLSLFVPHLSFLRCPGKDVFRDWGISWVCSLIFIHV